MVNTLIKRLTCACMMFVFISVGAFAQTDALRYQFDKKYGQVEVGGKYAGAEFHESRPLPSRISMYYPVANSIDLSTDYWKRGDSRPYAIGVQAGNGARTWLGREGWAYELSPHTVTFRHREGDLDYSLRYEFCDKSPAMVMTFTATNRSSTPLDFKAYTHLKAGLRTCQTYARKDSGLTSFDSTAHCITIDYQAPDAQNAVVFVENVGAVPSGWTTSSEELAATDSGTSNWISSAAPLGKTLFTQQKGPAIAAFEYQKRILPGDSLSVIQVLGSTHGQDAPGLIARLRSEWRNDVNNYSAGVERYAKMEAPFVTGDSSIDRSVIWAKGILAANQHNLDGTIIPMPCPAEYNFFFTHDVLMTDLAAVNFDPARVKRDLLYIAALVKADSIIPHAYYWRDDGYKTEFCTPENWNHLWFILTTASYLRHSNDAATCSRIYPFVVKSMREMLSRRKDDNLMYAYRPDWWDIGHRDGPRSYITVLTVRALRDFMYLTTALGKDPSELPAYEKTADAMQQALASKLWDPSLRYLINYNDSVKDTHYYMGSLLAPVYGVLDHARSTELVHTAEQEMLRRPVGVMVAAPPDFNTPENNAFFKFVGNEAGDPYVYINGGIWPHANAWYALALQSVGRVDDALGFVREEMTIDGVVKSPNGLPAMYEYRFSDSSSARFGAIDKPSFMWAAGFYLNTLYHLAGFSDNEWNVSLSAPVPSQWTRTSCSYQFGSQHSVSIKGTGGTLRSLSINGEAIPSLVLPLDKKNAGGLTLELGVAKRPYLESINAVLHHAEYAKAKKIILEVSSFAGHLTTAHVVAPGGIKTMTLDGKPLAAQTKDVLQGGVHSFTVQFTGNGKHQKLEIRY